MFQAVVSHARHQHRRAAIAAALVVAACGFSAASASAAAIPATNYCKGSVQRGADLAAPDTVNYQFSCSEDIKSYTLVLNREVGGFEVNSDVVDGAGAIVGTEGFACEGLIPGLGFNCAGGATPGHTVKSAFETSDSLCTLLAAKPDLTVQLVVSDKNANTEGPFTLSGLKACPGTKPKPNVKKPVKKPTKKPAKKHGKGGKAKPKAKAVRAHR